MKLIITIAVLLIAITGTATLFVGAYGGILDPETPIAFYPLTALVTYLVLAAYAIYRNDL